MSDVLTQSIGKRNIQKSERRPCTFPNHLRSFNIVKPIVTHIVNAIVSKNDSQWTASSKSVPLSQQALYQQERYAKD